jgi:hypothetical protein
MEGDRRVELPVGEPTLDAGPVMSGLGEPRGQPQRPSPHLFGLGQLLLRQPASVAALQRLGQPTEVSERQWGDPGADGELVRPLGACQLEGHQPGECPAER